MNIKNANYKEIKIRWNTITMPLRAGTPIGLSGLEENNGNAVGIIPQTVQSKPVTERIFVLVGGDVVLDEVEKEYGAKLSAEAMAAMSGIMFYGPDGTPIPDYVRTPYTLPAATASTLGGVKVGDGLSVTADGTLSTTVTVAENQAESAADALAGLVADFNLLLAKLKAAGIMEADAADATEE